MSFLTLCQDRLPVAAPADNITRNGISSNSYLLFGQSMISNTLHRQYPRTTGEDTMGIYVPYIVLEDGKYLLIIKRIKERGRARGFRVIVSITIFSFFSFSRGV